MQKIAIYGAGGFGKEIYCLIEEINRQEAVWEFVGYYDDGKAVGEDIYHGQVLGGMDALNAVSSSLAVVFAIGNPKIIAKLASAVNNRHIYFPNLIAPDFRVLDGETFSIGKGNLVFSKCTVSCLVELGDFNVLNSLIGIGHESKIGNYNVFMPGTRISGDVHIGNSNLFGIYSVVLPGVSIGHETVIGASSVVMNNTKDNSTYIGNPARKFDY